MYNILTYICKIITLLDFFDNCDFYIVLGYMH